MRHWLLKSEPGEFGISDLAARPRQTAPWDGVRNYQARNYLRAMKRGDRAFFYHSSCAEPGVAGVVEVVRAAYPDASARHARSPYHDPRATNENPVWFAVDVRLKEIFDQPVPLAAMRCEPALRAMPLVQRGSRLSVMPVTAGEWRAIGRLARAGVDKSLQPRRRKK